MATNKNALIRYQALDRCLRNRYKRHYIDDLVAACCEALAEFSDKAEPVHKRQIYKDLAFIEEKWGLDIDRIPDGRKKYFKYRDPGSSISQSQQLTDEEIDKLKETILMLNRFKGMPQFEWMSELLSQLEVRFGLIGQSTNIQPLQSIIQTIRIIYESVAI